MIRDKSWLRPVLFMVMILSLVAVASFFYNREAQLEHDYIRSVMRNTASVRGNFIQIWNSERISDARTILRTIPGGKEMVRLISQPGNSDLITALNEKFKVYIEEYKYSDIKVVSLKGELVYSFLENSKAISPETSSRVNKLLTGDSTYLNEIYYCYLHKSFFFRT